jgi:hypothetical protein
MMDIHAEGVEFNDHESAHNYPSTRNKDLRAVQTFLEDAQKCHRKTTITPLRDAGVQKNLSEQRSAG